MQYLVSEVLGLAPSHTGETKIFRNIPELIKYLNRMNKGEESRLRCEGQDFTAERLEGLLKHPLATASIYKEGDPNRKWVVTAF